MSGEIVRRGGWLSWLASLGLLIALVAYGVTEEVALGSLEGHVVMRENGMPLQRATVTITPVEMGEIGRPRVLTTDMRGNFIARNLPAGEYTVEASAKAHSLPPLVVTVAEGPPTPVELNLRPHAPRLELHASQRVFMPDEKPEFEAHGFGPDDRISIGIYRLRLNQIVEKGSVQSLLWSLRYDGGQRSGDPESVGELVATMEHTIQNRDAEGTFIDAVQLSELEEGFYLVRCTLGSIEQSRYFSVSSIGLITKSAPGATLCYVTNLQTGEPLENVEITTSANGVLTVRGQTNRDGVFTLGDPGPAGPSLVLASKGESRALTNFYRDEARASSPHTIFAYTDRPIYRPGDDINIKGFVRRRIEGGYELPGASLAKAEVYDANDTLVQTLDMQIAANGSFDGKFSTNREAQPGDYRVEIRANAAQQVVMVPVAAYRKPEYTVDVSWSRPFYPIGEKARATVKCEYYFGGPVVGAKVTAYVSRRQAWDRSYADDHYEAEGEYGYDEYSGGGELVEEIEAITNERGEATIEFDTERKNDPAQPQTDYWYTLEASVVDAGDKYFSGQGEVRVTRGEFALSVDTDVYVMSPNEQAQVTIRTTRHDNGKPHPHQQVQLIAGTETWARNESVFRPRKTYAATTDVNGVARITVSPNSDEPLALRAVATDRRGREIRSSAYIWVYGAALGRKQGAARLELTLDKDRYRAGDAVTALISTDDPGGAALLTVEGERILHQMIVPLDGATTTVSFDAKASYQPEVTVSLARIRNKTFQEANMRLRLDLAPRTLGIQVAADKQSYLPGDLATYSVKTVDADGAPVSADVSLAVVDESIYSIREDRVDPLQAFYSRQFNRVQTNYSFPELYLDSGDKAASINVRREFKDTAAWFPRVRTGSDGTASVEVKLPDNLTTWRATAIGVDDSTAAGKGSTKVVVSKPLMVRLQGPRVMTQQDRQEVSAMVTNATGRSQAIRVRLEPIGFAVREGLERTLELRNGETRPVTWTVTAGSSGDAKLVAKAWVDKGPSDGVEQRIEVLPHGRLVVRRGAGEIRSREQHRIRVRPDADEVTGGILVTFSPSIASTLYQSLDDLIGFPYGCVEQTMSRFLPTAVFSQALEGVETRRLELVSQVPEMVADGMARLGKMQHGDGGWGWWEYDETDPYMTAYVLDGLTRAQSAGYKVDPFMLERGLNKASEMMKSETLAIRPKDRAYLAFALASQGRLEPARLGLKKIDFDSSTSTVLALGALAHHAVGNKPEALSLLDRVRRGATIGPTTAEWPNDHGSWGAESSAWALIALQTVTPGDSLIPKVVRHLLASRSGDWWFSTRDTSLAVIGITAYIKSTGEVASGPSTVVVRLKGEEEARIELNPRDLSGVQPTVRIPMSKLMRGENRLDFEVEGSPLVYYSTVFTQVATADKVGQYLASGDFRIERHYYVLKPQRTEDGSLRLMPSDKPVTRARAGDLIRCVLTITTDRDREYIMVEDPTPSNCRPTERETPGDGEEWSWWWSSTVINDGKVAMFARHLPAGSHTITYTMRAESPGTSHVMPPVASNMYDPDDRASAAETELEVRR